MAAFWRRRARDHDAELVDLGRRAKSALVAADERVRVTADELDFAVAELGEEPAADLRAALDAVRVHLREAFHLQQLLHDEIPDTPAEQRAWNARIVELCGWAEGLLEEKTAELAGQIARVRRAPEVLAQVRADAESLTARLEPIRETLARLHARYSASALGGIAASADEAERLIAFAHHSAEVSEQRRSAGCTPEANHALETAAEATRRARAVLDGVQDFEIDALRAESTLGHLAGDARANLAEARRVPSDPEIERAAEEVEKALGALVPAQSDPFAELGTMRRAAERLDRAVAAARRRAENPPPPREHVQHALDDADRQLGIARGLIAGHRGWIGADARTRLAEAERLRAEVAGLVDLDDTRHEALALSRRVAERAAEALQLAQRDIDSSRPGDGWGGERRGDGVATGILGGLVLGSLLDGLFD